MPAGNFNGLAVLTLESRRGAEMSRLIETYGGRPIHAPAMREVPLSSNKEALRFADELFAGRFDIVIFLTGVGARALANAIATDHPLEKFITALRHVKTVARGPKPAAVLREWDVPIAVSAPEPNTWRELLQALDAKIVDVQGRRIAVQEYGVSNPELLDGLRERGAHVTAVPVYRWHLPEDIRPLEKAVLAIVDGKVDVILFTTQIQAVHLFRIAERIGKEEALKTALLHVTKASIGPTTSEALRNLGLNADLEASHPKIGFLVKEAAEQAQNLSKTHP